MVLALAFQWVLKPCDYDKKCLEVQKLGGEWVVGLIDYTVSSWEFHSYFYSHSHSLELDNLMAQSMIKLFSGVLRNCQDS